MSAYGTFLHNKRSFARTERIESGVSKNIEIGINTKEEILHLKDQNLLQQITIENLRQENIDLYSKLAETSTNIYNLNKDIQYPLPKEAIISFELGLKFDSVTIEKIDSIITAKYDFNKIHTFGGFQIHFELLDEVINWQEFSKNINIYFSKSFHTGLGLNPIFELANYNTLQSPIPKLKFNENNNLGNVALLYSPATKEIGLNFENIPLSNQISRSWDSKTNYNARSIRDLENSTIIIKIFAPKTGILNSITSFKLSSQELVLPMVDLKKSHFGPFFYFDIKSL